MPLFTWNDSYSVSVQQFDDQHKVLFNLVNDLHDAMAQGKGRDRIGQTLNTLISYTRGHFSAEETALRKAGYPQYEQHKKEHDAFTAKVLDFETTYKAGTSNVTVDLMGFLREWLSNHILKIDKQYASYLKN
jgi:hemerythrin